MTETTPDIIQTYMTERNREDAYCRAGMSATQLAALLDEPIWKVNAALQNLIEMGLVKNV